jgi:streptogramin lyase
MLTWLRQGRRGLTRSPGTQRRRRPSLESLEDRCLLAGLTEFTTGITAASSPTNIAVGADGNLWFTEFGADKIGRITPTGTVHEFTLPAGSNPLDITAGPAGDSRLYFTENGTGKIGSIDPTAATDVLIQLSVVESNALADGATAGVNGIAVGSDGNLWFTETGDSKIGTISRTNLNTATFTETPTTTAGASPADITSGPDGALWFTETSPGAIGRITTAGAVTNEFAVSAPAGAVSDPEHIVSGPGGVLFFTDFSQNQADSITTAGVITKFQLPVDSGPQDITVGPDGNLWFTETAGNRVGSITPAGVVAAQVTQGITADRQPLGIVTGPDNNLWFTEAGDAAATPAVAPGIGQLVPDKPLTATGTASSPTATVAFTGPIASFTDADTTAVPADFAVTINWGDNTAVDTNATLTPVNGQAGHFTVSGAHTYAASGTDMVTVTITDINTTVDAGGSTATATSTATVSAVGTRTTLTTSPSQVTAGQSINLTATVAPTLGNAVPTGMVVFLDGGVPLGLATLNASGKATLTTTMLSAGTHSLTAGFVGGSSFASSASTPVTVMVSPAVSTTPLTGDVTSDVRATLGTVTRVKKKRFTETLTLKNTSTSPLQGPLNVVLRGLRKNIKVAGAKSFGKKNKKTQFVVINPTGGALQPGADVQITLTFNARPNTFTVSVFANTTPK